MNRRNRRGFLMTYVIVAMALMGMVMAVLTSGATTMLFRADAAYLQAVERNLTASGLAWAQAKLAGGSYPPAAEPAELDLAPPAAQKATVAVSVLEVRDNVARVRINTSCTRGRRTLTASHDYAIELAR